MFFTPTRWRPDTCGCELIQYEFTAEMIKPCEDHKEDNGQVPFDENQGLDRTLTILEKMGLIRDDVKWEFEKVGRGRRKLRIHIPSGLGVVFDPRDIKHIEIVSK